VFISGSDGNTLDEAGMACHGQTLQLIANICKLRMLKSFITGPNCRCWNQEGEKRQECQETFTEGEDLVRLTSSLR
jgi:hypothetical protein